MFTLSNPDEKIARLLRKEAEFNHRDVLWIEYYQLDFNSFKSHPARYVRWLVMKKSKNVYSINTKIIDSSRNLTPIPQYYPHSVFDHIHDLRWRYMTERYLVLAEFLPLDIVRIIVKLTGFKKESDSSGSFLNIWTNFNQ